MYAKMDLKLYEFHTHWLVTAALFIFFLLEWEF